MEKLFDLEIVSPDKAIFAGKVKSVQVPGSQGGFQVLVNHAPIISTLDKGKIRIAEEDGKLTEFSAIGGVIEVLNNHVIILVEKLMETGKVKASEEEE
jgi:F-type H+-transporting ATPase subunit epsilon